MNETTGGTKRVLLTMRVTFIRKVFHFFSSSSSIHNTDGKQSRDFDLCSEHRGTAAAAVATALDEDLLYHYCSVQPEFR